uniref:Uncharacterized protein n=1 Tax=Meleagris gallopavo TaxID=9103 RepID=A0A803Y5G8_MELGA
MDTALSTAQIFGFSLPSSSPGLSRAVRFVLGSSSPPLPPPPGRGKWFATKRTPRALSPGLNLLHSPCQSEEDEKLKKRKERFGIVTSSAGAGATEDTEVKAHEVDRSRGDPSAAIGLPLNCCPISPTAVSTGASHSVPAWTQSVHSPSSCSAVPCPGCP